MAYVELGYSIKPENPDSKIWRYMDLAKFLDLLDRESLYFSRVDKLNDPVEGTLARPTKDLIYKTVPANYTPDDVMRVIVKQFNLIKQYTWVNSWHLNDYMSDAMWKIYATGQGVAVQSTYNRLIDSISQASDDVDISRVVYIDYRTEPVPYGLSYYPVIYKRKEFEHEKELRAFIHTLPDDKVLNGLLPAMETPEGKYVTVDIDLLIENIYIAPNTPKWICDLIRSIVKKYQECKKRRAFSVYTYETPYLNDSEIV